MWLDEVLEARGCICTFDHASSIHPSEDRLVSPKAEVDNKTLVMGASLLSGVDVYLSSKAVAASRLSVVLRCFCWGLYINIKYEGSGSPTEPEALLR